MGVCDAQDLHVRYEQAARMTRSELLGQDRHGNRYYAFDVLPGLIVERFVPVTRAPPATELVPLPPAAAADEGGEQTGDQANGQAGETPMDSPAPSAAVAKVSTPQPAAAAAPCEAEVLEAAMSPNNHLTVPWATYTDPALVNKLIGVLHENVCHRIFIDI